MTRPVSKVCCFTLSLAFLATMVTACNQPPGVNPWRDDAIPISAADTPSMEGVLAAGHEPVFRQREMPHIAFAGQMPVVPHYPLWWEDPFEDKGDGDDQFALTYADYIAMPYGLGRFLLNTVAWPVSAVVTPPGTPMVSDGRVSAGKDHDAKRGISPDPRADASDFGRFVSEPTPPETDDSSQ